MEKELRKNSGIISYIVLMVIGIPSLIWAVYEIYREQQEISAFLIGMSVILAIMISVALSTLIKKMGRGFMKGINAYLQKDPEVTMEDLEEEFQVAERCGKKIWIGKNYIFGLSPYGSWPYIFPMKEASSIQIIQRKKRVMIKPFILYVDVYFVQYYVDGEEYRVYVGRKWEHAKIIKDELETANLSEKYVSAMEKLHQAWIRKQQNNIWN